MLLKAKKKKREPRKRESEKLLHAAVHEPMRISMECLPLGMFSEGLYSDLVVLLLEFLSHTGVSQVPADSHMLTN